MRTSEEGFTLLELLLAMSMMLIVFGTVASAFAVSLRSTDEGTRRVSESQDGAFTSHYLVKDVQSAQTVTTGAAGACAGAGDLVLTLSWTDPVVTETVTYRFVPPAAGTAGRLVRHSCGSTVDVQSVADDLTSVALDCYDPTTCDDAGRVVLTLEGQQDADFAITATRRLP